MRSILRGIIIGLVALVLLAPAANAASRWLYAGCTSGTSFYIDSYTICPTNGGDLSMYVRAAGPRGSCTMRLVIDLESRNYCWPDSSDPYWKAIPPESILEDIWAVAYRVKYGG